MTSDRQLVSTIEEFNLGDFVGHGAWDCHGRYGVIEQGNPVHAFCYIFRFSDNEYNTLTSEGKYYSGAPSDCDLHYIDMTGYNPAMAAVKDEPSYVDSYCDSECDDLGYYVYVMTNATTEIQFATEVPPGGIVLAVVSTRKEYELIVQAISILREHE